eukprot:COSAG02_NODE_515_length_20817_cov_61.106960_1_plen_48_part_00
MTGGHREKEGFFFDVFHAKSTKTARGRAEVKLRVGSYRRWSLPTYSE